MHRCVYMLSERDRLSWRRAALIGAEQEMPRAEQRIYVDNNASTPMCSEALAALNESFRTDHGNASAVAYREGARARAVLESCRARIEDLCGAPRGTHVFTSGASESNQLAFQLATAAYKNLSTSSFCSEPTMVLSAVEHKSADIGAVIATSGLGRIVRIPVLFDGRIVPENVIKTLDEQFCDTDPAPAVVATMLVQNELGAVLEPAAVADAVAAWARRRAHPTPVAGSHIFPVLLFDAAQAVGRMDMSASCRLLSTSPCGIMLSWSAHKFCGPLGVGGLFVGGGVGTASPTGDGSTTPATTTTTECLSLSGRALTPVHAMSWIAPWLRTVAEKHHIHDPREFHLRTGTENVPGICSAVAALAAATDAKTWDSMRQLVGRISLAFAPHTACEKIRFNGPAWNDPARSVCNVLNFSVRDECSLAMIAELDALGIAVGNGSACANGSVSHILSAIGLPQEYIRGTIRISLSRLNTSDQIDRLIAALQRVCLASDHCTYIHPHL